MTNVQSTDYVYAVTLVRIWENKMISSQTFAKLYEQGNFDDVMNAAHEAGYASNMPYDDMLSDATEKTYADLRKIAPNADVFDLFLIKNDYHNIKVLLRSNALQKDMDRLLFTHARFSLEVVKSAAINEKFEDVNEFMKCAYLEGQDILASSHNPQLADIVVDRYMFDDLLKEAYCIGNEFLINLFRTEIDLTNLKMVFRLQNMRKDSSFAKKVIIPGGTIDKDVLVEVSTFSSESIGDFYSKTIYHSILENVSELTQIEMRCDSYYQKMLQKASEISFGIEPLVAYLLKKEEEIKKLRMLLVAKKNHIEMDILAERLGVSHA